MKWLVFVGYFALAGFLVAAELFCAIKTVTDWPESSKYAAGVVIFFCLYLLVRQTFFSKVIDFIKWR